MEDSNFKKWFNIGLNDSGWFKKFRRKYKRKKTRLPRVGCNCGSQNSDLATCCCSPETNRESFKDAGTESIMKICKLKLTSGNMHFQRYFCSRISTSKDKRSQNTAQTDTFSNDDDELEVYNKKLIESSNMCSDLSNSQKALCHHADKRFAVHGHGVHSSEMCAIYCQLSKHGWYWGGIATKEAEELLAGQLDGVFLVRDSFHVRHLLCVSFRCVGRTLHARLRHANGLFSLNNETFVSVNKLSEHCTSVTLAGASGLETVPVKLAAPLNRFAKLDSLQLLCRFILRQSIRPEDLPLPPDLLKFVNQGTDYSPP